MQDNRTYAGFWVRFFAYLLDSVIVFAGLLIVRLILWGFMMATAGTPIGGNILFHYNLKDIILYLAEVAYFVLFTYYTGTTLGKRALNLRVVGKESEPLSLFTVIYRESIGRFLSGVILCVGYLMIVVDKEKRGLHDILCDTRVIYAKNIKVYEKKVTAPEPIRPVEYFPGETASERTDQLDNTAAETAGESEVHADNADEMNKTGMYRMTDQTSDHTTEIHDHTERDS